MSGMPRVADAIRSCWEPYNRDHRLPPHVVRTVKALLRCRTASLGGHLYQCDQCGSQIPVYNSCKDRHCPTCQSMEREAWIAAQTAHVLPVPYFHVVFTVPHELNELINANRTLLLGEMFRCVNQVLQSFARDPQWRLKGQLGFLAMLHTWNQRLGQHYHIHCLVPGGAWREESHEFIICKGQWLFKKTSLADAFRNAYLKRLEKLHAANKLVDPGDRDHATWARYCRHVRNRSWVVYPKHVPSTPEKALEYLARYTYRVAISDYRIKDIKGGEVSYSWLDRSDHNKEKIDTIPVETFTKRFIQHILPRGFKKVRFYGWMSSARRKHILPKIREILNVEAPEPMPDENPAERLFRRTGLDVSCCPVCSKGKLIKQPFRLHPVRGP